MKMIKIEWLDSEFDSSEWQSLSNYDFKPLKPCVSVGFVIKETNLQWFIAQNISGDSVSNVFTIPKRSVLSWEELYTSD